MKGVPDMSIATKLPYEFVNFMTKPGLDCDAGVVALNQYMCQTIAYGGNDNTTALIGNLRWMKEGGNGAKLNVIAGSAEIDLLLKGQGSPDTFVGVWDFMCRNKEQLKDIKVTVGHRQKGIFVADKTGNIFKLYFDGNPLAVALQMMVKDRFFGIDCIGFVANYLIYVNEWDKYYGYNISQWDQVFTQNVKKAVDIKPLDILLWDSHIAIVDWVNKHINEKTVLVDICQCSSGGPQSNEYVKLTETGATNSKGYKLFNIADRGTPAMPVYSDVFIMRRKGFSYFGSDAFPVGIGYA
jgi:hypothetical protein